MAEIERIYIKDLTLHSRESRPTTKFSKVAEKGRMYRPIGISQTKEVAPTGFLHLFDFELPQDLKERVDRGEVEIMMPEDGVNIYLGDDAQEKLTQLNAQARRELIHRSRGKDWHAE